MGIYLDHNATSPLRPEVREAFAAALDSFPGNPSSVHGPGRAARAALDRAARDGVPLDVHVGSKAVQRFIEERQPRLTLHGHIHESARMTGAWSDCIGDTVCLSAAHHGPELALVSFEPGCPADATRRLVEG